MCVRSHQGLVRVFLLELLSQTESKETDGHHRSDARQRSPHTFIEAEDTLETHTHTSHLDMEMNATSFVKIFLYVLLLLLLLYSIDLNKDGHRASTSSLYAKMKPN